VLGHAGKVVSLGKQYQGVLTSKPPDGVRSLVAESGPQYLLPFAHGHTGKRASSHLAGLEQGYLCVPF
jgi:hypothetical protein